MPETNARADAPGAAAAVTPPTTADPPLADQVVNAARIVVREGRAQMEVRLEPPTLGSVRVSASATPEGVGLTIAAERPETRVLLEQAIPEIQAALTVRGVLATSIAVAAHFDPPDARRAPARRDSERGERGGDQPRHRNREASRPVRVGAVDLTV